METKRRAEQGEVVVVVTGSAIQSHGLGLWLKSEVRLWYAFRDLENVVFAFPPRCASNPGERAAIKLISQDIKRISLEKHFGMCQHIGKLFSSIDSLSITGVRMQDLYDSQDESQTLSDQLERLLLGWSLQEACWLMLSLLLRYENGKMCEKEGIVLKPVER